uniref:Uncharacterized protein n=1 Tax=Oryza brachyantha TaxID=4533 RepID=J3MBE8_ORYBR
PRQPQAAGPTRRRRRAGEESGQRPRGAWDGAQDTESAAARNPARPKRRQATEKAGVERRRRRRELRREEVADEKTLGELGMA